LKARGKGSSYQDIQDIFRGCTGSEQNVKKKKNDEEEASFFFGVPPSTLPLLIDAVVLSLTQ